MATELGHVSQFTWQREEDMAEEGVIGCHTVEQWKEHFDREKNSQKLVVVDFTASWCPPCRFMAPILAEIAKRMTHVLFLNVDVDELKEIADEYEVYAMPTFVFLKEGKEIETVVGADQHALERKISNHASMTA